MIIDEKALTADIFERYDRAAGAEERDREHIAALVSLAHSVYLDLQIARSAWDFIDTNEPILEAAWAFEGCSGSHLITVVIELARERRGVDVEADAVHLVLLGVVKSAARIGLQLVMSETPTPTNAPEVML